MRCFECSSISSANDEGKERQRSRYGAQDLPREDRGLNALGADLSKGFICGGFVKNVETMLGQGNKNAWTRHCKRLDKATPMPGQGREETGPGTRKALATHSKITSIMFAAIFHFQSPPHNCQFGFDVALSGDGYVRSLRAMGMVIIDHNKQDIGSCRFQEMLKNAGIVPDVLIQKNDEEQKYQVVATHPMEVHVVNTAPQRVKKKKIAIAAFDVLQDYKVVKDVAVQVSEKRSRSAGRQITGSSSANDEGSKEKHGSRYGAQMGALFRQWWWRLWWWMGALFRQICREKIEV